MLEHVSIPVRSYDRSKEFYTAALAPLGYALNDALDFPGEACGFIENGHTSFWISQREHKETVHIAFAAPSKEAVHKFYEAALRGGARDNGAPGYRTEYSAEYYAAFVFDPDGNNIEAVWYDPER